MKKTSKTQIANVYAKAIYDASKTADKTFKEVETLLPAIEDSFIDFLSNPIIDISIKKSAISDISKQLKLSKELFNALCLITENNKSKELPDILREFISLYYIKNNIIEVEVISVQELQKTQQKQLANKLEKNLGKKVVINYQIKPEILGGLIIKYQSLMIDSSLKSKLNQITKIMKGEQLCL